VRRGNEEEVEVVVRKSDIVQTSRRERRALVGVTPWSVLRFVPRGACNSRGESLVINVPTVWLRCFHVRTSPHQYFMAPFHTGQEMRL
jgi:hypothetical protein